jgi:hypothetical protein
MLISEYKISEMPFYKQLQGKMIQSYLNGEEFSLAFKKI